MKMPHLLRVEAPAESFADLFAAARALGLRLGWLDLVNPVEPPASLEAAAALGALRAVATGGGRSVAVKPLAGPPVLRDLLREHFRGCAAVLIAGEGGLGWDPLLTEAPRLQVQEGALRLRAGEGDGETVTAAVLAARLRQPRL